MSSCNSNHRVTIATSIMPRRLDEQLAAIDTWLRLGFEVISVNVSGEVEHLRELFPAVHFVEVRPLEQEGSRRFHVPINSLLDCLTSSSGAICGIVNSDISFRVRENFTAFIEDNAAGGMVFGSRIDVDGSVEVSAEEYCLGFDYFFFDKGILPRISRTDFRLGMPYWDYWFPLALYLRRTVVKRLVSPVAYHICHDTSWSPREEGFAGYFLNGIRDVFSEIGKEDILNVRMLAAVELADTDKLSEVTRYVLRDVVPTLIYDPAIVNDSTLVTINKAAFTDMRSRLQVYERQLGESSSALHLIHISVGWRLTAPLRILKAIFKKLTA